MTLNKRIQRISGILTCIDCGGSLKLHEDKMICQACSKSYPVRNGKIYFTQPPKTEDKLDSLKSVLKKLMGDYYHKIGIGIIAPTFPINYKKELSQRLDLNSQIVVDLGCGNHRIDENIIGIDVFDYDAVDLVCDIFKLPFKSNSVDAFVSRSVLEHVPNPWMIIQGCRNCTKSEGLGIHIIPFLYPFHASPYDYNRFTHKGLEALFNGWRILEQFNVTGPVTLFLVCMIEFLSILLSFGSEKIKSYLYLLLCLTFFPLKYLDIFFVRKERFLSMAPTILTVVQKEASADLPSRCKKE